tara:strand:- start:386 stop:763 length:378 start_codon:yes stop_codon:yes gene_type:complete
MPNDTDTITLEMPVVDAMTTAGMLLSRYPSFEAYHFSTKLREQYEAQGVKRCDNWDDQEAQASTFLYTVTMADILMVATAIRDNIATGDREIIPATMSLVPSWKPFFVAANSAVGGEPMSFGVED